MIEIVFGESACGSLKIAQTYGKGKYRGSAVSIFMRHEDGSVPSSDEMKKAQLQAQEQERIAWENAIPLGGKSSDVYCFDMALSVGDISDNGIGEQRKNIFKKMLSVCFVEDLDYQVEEKIQKIKTTLTSVIERYVAGEEIRIWYSYNPDELCGMYWLMKQLQPLNCQTTIYLVKLPTWEYGKENTMTSKIAWGEVSPGEWGNYITLQEKAMIENRMMTGNRVDCLYRVSTDKQVDYNDKSQADIPMQRRECHRFCEKMGWTIVHEEQEDGVSGHKVRAENRDKLQIIKERAKQGKFDILLVFMFDRIGRIADETPFVVEWFVKNGIRVWSTQEGEQRFDNHTDKLTNYIRFWQADGESEKTSIRTKTALGQLVEDGGFKGGLAPYGYDLVKSGRFNKRKHEVFELAVNEAEAAVVRIIFDKYVHEGFGAQRIATYLNNLGYRARTGKMWHHASIRGIICNLTYTGVLRSGESRSQTLPHLQIVTPELFEAAQHIRTSRANSAEQERRVPLNTRGQSLLAGNVFCGHCGSRLALTTNGKAYPCKEDARRIVKRVRYICYGKTRKQTECDGQTGYTAHILDGIIDKVVRQIFERMKAIPKSEIVNIRYREKMEERKALLKSAKSDYAKAAAELDTLRAEVIKSLRGESAFSQELLSSLIADGEKKCLAIQRTMEAAQAAYDEGQVMLDALNAQYDDIISWAEMYDSASMESKKMIVSCLIRRVEVYRDYRLHIDFNIDFEQFSAGLDISAIAA